MQFGKTILAAAMAATLVAGASGAAAASDTKAGKRTQAAVATKAWTARGGDVGIRWNYDLAADLGLKISPAGVQGRLAADGAERFDAKDGFDFLVEDGYLRAFQGGAITAAGGYDIALDAGGRIDMAGFRVVPKRGEDGRFLRLDIVDAQGQGWFYVDRLMHELFTGDETALTVSSSDIRISPALAKRIGHAYAADWYIGELQFDLPVATRGSGEAGPQGTNFKWHGTAAPNGGTYLTDLFMLDTFAQTLRCRGCTGNAGTGEVVITPSSTLKNNVNAGTIQQTVAGDPLGTSTALWTASVPWYQKFSGRFPPYDNDQHPYLIWNMYKVAADGSIEQIGRSGIKQAYLTTNGGCLEGGADNDSHVLGRGCTDTYSTGNNDYTQGLSPRSELLPAQGIWGRCGSTFDPGCTGSMVTQPGDNYTYRMIVREQQISPTVNPGASYIFESWYLARQDINIYNSMSTLATTQSWTGSTWNTQSGDEKLGSAIDRWYATGAPPSGRRVEADRHIQELKVGDAHAKVAVKVTRQQDGNYRYDYAVMNFDFAFGTLSGTNPNMRVSDNQGFDGFTLNFSSAASATATAFRDGDTTAANDWTFSTAGTSAGWRDATDAPNSLWWGGLYSFAIVSPHGPRIGSATLHATHAPTPATFRVKTLVPGGR